MSWAPLATESAFLVFSVLSGTAAAVVLLRGIVRSKLHGASHSDLALSSRSYSELGNGRQLPGLLDRITLLNKNLIQCPRCSTIDYAHARFCTRCGTAMQSSREMPTYNVRDVEARYLTQDDSTRVFGVSMRIDPKTRIGVIIGIQNRESPEQINETEERT